MELTKAKERNVELYTRYKMFSWDLLFYYAIIFLFFTQVKNISAADVFLAESAYPLFKIIFLIPATILIERIGKRKSLIIGNSFILFSTITYILATNFYHILLGEFFSAIGFIIKGICETNMLYDSLERNEKRGSKFSKIDGRGLSLYYYIDATSSVVSGFLFSINGYLPMIFCMITNVISVILSIQFKEIDKVVEEPNAQVDNKKNVTLKRELKDLKKSLKSIFKSDRLKNLIIFGAVFSGVLSVLSNLRSSLLSDIGVPAQYFGIISAVFGIISGISARNQNRFHKAFRNRTLSKISVPVVISCIIMGILCKFSTIYMITVSILLIFFLVQYIAKGPFYTLIRQYMNNFTTATLRNKISSSFNLLESLFRALFTFLASLSLRYTSTDNVSIILGCIFTIMIVLLLDNMRNKVGLKPEEYKENDLKILELK